MNCYVCHAPLQSRCHYKNGRVYCAEHYFRYDVFRNLSMNIYTLREYAVQRCAGCNEGINPNAMVFRLQVLLGMPL